MPGTVACALVGVVVAADEAYSAAVGGDEGGEGPGGVGGVEVAHVDEHDVGRDGVGGDEAGDEEGLVGVVGRDIKEGRGKFEAVAEDEVEAVVGIAAGDLLGLSDGDVFGVGGVEAGVMLEAGDAVVGELGPAAVVDDAGEEEDDFGGFGLGSCAEGEGG